MEIVVNEVWYLSLDDFQI